MSVGNKKIFRRAYLELAIIVLTAAVYNDDGAARM